MSRRLTRLGSLSALLGLAACGSLLGIEDIHEGPAPGDDAGADSNAGETSAHAGASHAGSGSGGASHAGGSNLAGNDQPNGGNGANGGRSGNNGGAENAGAEDQAGAAGASESGAVHGQVIDFWGHPLSQVALQIAGKKTTTDAQGSFTVPDVPAEYDASLVVEFIQEVKQTHAYSYLGLTRRDPTLQVFRGLDAANANLDVTFTNADQSLTDARTLGFALAGPDGSFEKMGATKGGVSTSVRWFGPHSTIEHAYALIWENDAVSGLPLSYHAFATGMVPLVDGVVDHVPLMLDLSPKTITAGTISGNVAATGGANRINSVSLRSDSGASLRLLLDTAATTNFSYVVPTIANASISFAAANGCTSASAGCAIVHRESLGVGASAISVSIPSPATALSASPAGAVDENTTFSFTASPGVYVSVLDNSLGNDRLVIVTNQPSFKIPKQVGSYSLARGATYWWTVQAHGSPANVDAAAGPSGFIDPYGLTTGSLEPTGLAHKDGSFTASVRKTITIAN